MAEVPQLSLASRSTASRALLATNTLLLSRDAALRFPRFDVLIGQGPILTEAPTNPARAYTASDGTKWFVPRARLARRSETSRVPDIRFDRRPNGVTLVLVIDLVRELAIPTDAKALSISGFRIQLVGSPIAPDWQIEDQPSPAGVERRLRIGAALDDAGVNTLVSLMQTRPDAWFKLDGNVLYQSQAGPTAGQTPPIIIRHPIEVAALNTAVAQNRFMVRALPSATLERIALAPSAATTAAIRLQPMRTPGPAPGPPAQQSLTVQLSTPQSLSASFPPGVGMNQVIYAEVTGGIGGDIDSHWVTDANLGDLKESPRFNQYYLLPDAFGLALDPDHAMPEMTAQLIPGPDPAAEGTAAYRVRVRFGVAPHVEAARTAGVRELLRNREGLAFADLAIGGYKQATFEAANLLEQLGAPAGSVPASAAAVNVDPRNGFDISLDLTVEQYALLANQLTAATGSLRGRVRFVLDSDATTTLQRDVDVSLRLDRPVEHALVVGAPAGSVAGGPPDRLTLQNPSALAVTVGAATASLLAVDEGVPLEARDATVAPGTFTVPPGGSVDLAFAPVTDAGDKFTWNALSLTLDRVATPFAPGDVLAHVHELAASTRVPGRLRVWSWPLQQQGRLPSELEGKLFGLDVEIRRHTEDAPITVTLTVGEAEKQVDFGFTLADLAGGAAPEQSTFQVRRRNKLVTGPGQWSEWAAQTGRELHCDLVLTT